MTRRRLSALLIPLMVAAACSGGDSADDEAGDAAATVATAVGTAVVAATQAPIEADSGAELETKLDLWSSGETLLRGANIWQAIVIPELDGDGFKGTGRVGPPYAQADFDELAELGANYVSISGPGLFAEKPPFEVDEAVVAHLDGLLGMVAAADMFATIGFRTGPGRSEYGLCCGGDEYFEGYFNNSVWEDEEARTAWAEMWNYTADRYRDNPVVAGYKLMVEPNAGATFFDFYEPQEFYPDNAGTGYDWNEFYPLMVAAIREVDDETPILLGGMGFSSVRWMPYLEPAADSGIVYVAHQYEPFDDYTHQEPLAENSYPGVFDLDYDGVDDDFDHEWIDEELLQPLDEFLAQTGGPGAIDEFGVNRWVPGAPDYMRDLIASFEDRGLNHALWEWQTSWPEFRDDVNSMDFRFGPDPDNLTSVDNALLDAIVASWSQNRIRPSDW